MLKETPLIQEHRRCGAKFVDFHGWKLPLEFSGSTKEHLNVRKSAGLFDVSQMGEIRVVGAGALSLLTRCLTNNSASLKKNHAQYSLMCNERGGIVDDLILYCLEPERDYLLCVNASRVAADLCWLKQHISSGAEEAQAQMQDQEAQVQEVQDQKVQVQDQSDRWAQLALQGPRSPELLSAVLDSDFGSAGSPAPASVAGSPEEAPAFGPKVASREFKKVERVTKATSVADSSEEAPAFGPKVAPAEMKKNTFQWYDFLGVPVLVSATGYTGEKGFEILISPEKAPALWRAILDRGQNGVCLPAGLCARDTLRMEMKYPLYGADLNEEIDPHSAGLSWAVKNTGDFIGSSALAEIKRGAGARKKWVGFKLLQSVGVPRPRARIFAEGSVVGEVSSGARSPTLGQMIGLGYVQAGRAGEVGEVEGAGGAGKASGAGDAGGVSGAGKAGAGYSAPGSRIEVEIHQKRVPAEVVATPFVKIGCP